MSLNPLIEFFPRDRMFHCELSQTLPFLWEVLQSHVSKKRKCVYSLCYGRCRKRSGNTRVQRESLMTSQGYLQMAGVEQAVAEQRTRNVHPYQSEPVVPLPVPGEQNSAAFEANCPEQEEQDATNRLGNTDWWVSRCRNSSRSHSLLTSSAHAVVSVDSPDVILCGWLGLKHQLTN